MSFDTAYWKAQAAACLPALIKDLAPLIAIESIREDDKATTEAPFGPGPAQALDYMLKLAERDGFTTYNDDNYVGVIHFGEGQQTLGLLGHLDVVPATGNWITPPFEMTVRDNRLYGRGTSDDKGPVMACYYALKLLKEAGIVPQCRIDLILGTDEESGWECMTHYFASHPLPDIAFSPDADFPIINGEKGMVSLPLQFSLSSDEMSDITLESFEGGVRLNIVPEDAKAVLTGKNLDSILDGWLSFINNCDGLEGSAAIVGDTLTLTAHGKPAHAMEPEQGLNACTYLASFLSTLNLGRANPYCTFISQYLHHDFTGQSLGIASHDDIMGELTVNPGLFAYQSDKAEIFLNVRFPRSTTLDAIYEKLNQLFHELPIILGKPIHPKEVHYVPANDPLVRTLLDVYTAHTGQPASEHSIGGGTYGRLVPRGVAYGMTMPESDVVIHQANESCLLTDLEAAVAIFADAIYQLSKNTIL